MEAWTSRAPEPPGNGREDEMTGSTIFNRIYWTAYLGLAWLAVSYMPAL